MKHAPADALLENVWGDRGFPVDPVWIANELGLDVVEIAMENNVSGALLKNPNKIQLLSLTGMTVTSVNVLPAPMNWVTMLNGQITVNPLNISSLITVTNCHHREPMQTKNLLIILPPVFSCLQRKFAVSIARDTLQL